MRNCYIALLYILRRTLYFAIVRRIRAQNWQRFYVSMLICQCGSHGISHYRDAKRHIKILVVLPISTYNHTLHILQHMQVNDNRTLLLFVKYARWWACVRDEKPDITLHTFTLIPVLSVINFRQYSMRHWRVVIFIYLYVSRITSREHFCII